MQTERQSFGGGLRFILGMTVLVALLATPGVNLAQDSAELVLEYGHVHHMLAEQDPVPMLRVYADGRVKVHYPAYMTRAGEYELRLSKGELAALINQLGTELSTIDFDVAKAEREAIEAQRASEGQLYHVSDVTETIIRYRRSVNDSNPLQTVRWPNVYTDARAFPDLVAVQILSATEARLKQLLDRPDLTRTGG